ncbi:uncharacterized protein SPSK_07313 [Sporothrix schenckii 1099-18]|uniref:F-box domain-containing protein n=2 Tax=Sporothrix schenckii TaxID=29908 RepID=U7Q2J4_SPOS1|nr:uncharacterized protein SPSK_07313 [Sporothrix schenckii 1099-18]ERT01240.1 hypothetical protein HMPREF1624_02482 [Sporothrix schenckii ATCC 58251]KJR88388.1 hypothetical protein SPSK_07313 [Sporothrix schenckii 1099-18]
MSASLPLDVWLLVCEELTASRDFDALYNFSRVSRTMANFALPSLYSIYELASASADDASIVGKRKLAILWRAIILSSSGKTAFPYCLWMQNLKLGDFKELLSDIAPNSNLRQHFFQGDMASYEMMLQSTTANVATRRNRPRLDLPGIITKVGNAITLYVKEAADRDNRAVALTHLEGQSIPLDVLPSWTSRLATLMSLHIQDGSVIGEEVAKSIRDNCPRFRELRCFYCNGPTVDKDLAAFFRTIPPNSLKVFSVSSQNHMGKESLAALSLHSSSLQRLGLSGLQSSAFEHLGSLRECVSLESLELEANRGTAMEWESTYSESFADTVAWLSACTSLTSLKLWHVECASSLLKLVLKAPKLRLASLDLNLIDDNDEFYASLGKQTTLEGFYLRSNDVMLDAASPQHAQFIQSVCKLENLRVLDIMQTTITDNDLHSLAVALTNLEELSFDGDAMGDSILSSILLMHNLKNININASTNFTVEGLLQFIDTVGEMHGSNCGLTLFIMNQALDAQIFPDEEQFLTNHAHATFGGKIDISHPEEEHESDFSD